MKSAISYIKYAILMGFGVVCFGTVGYMLIEGWSLLEALYMTVITLTTVGFSEIHELSNHGRMFTIALIGSGVFTIAFTVQVVVRFIVEENVFSNFGRNRMRKHLARIKDHIIVCGNGRIGGHVVDEFRENGRGCVVIDKDAPEEDSKEQYIYLRGDATDEDLLLMAGIERAGCLVAVVGSDADNLFITMSARGLNPGLRIISRATDARAKAKLLRAGADSVVMPYEIGGRRIAGLVLKPALIEFLDMTATMGGEELHFEEIVICENCWLGGQDMISADIRRRTGAVILAVKRADGSMLTNPGTDLVFTTGDKLLSLGTTQQITSLRDLASSGRKPQ